MDLMEWYYNVKHYPNFSHIAAACVLRYELLALSVHYDDVTSTVAFQIKGFHQGILNLAMEPSVLGSALLEGGPDRTIKLDQSPGVDEVLSWSFLNVPAPHPPHSHHHHHTQQNTHPLRPPFFHLFKLVSREGREGGHNSRYNSRTGIKGVLIHVRSFF